jgi:hypothetical protein
MLNNMKEPTVFFNNVLQGDFKRAGITVARFVVNTTIGVGGIVDVMALNGVERDPADFGQTLYIWGVSPGPYLVLPILGPSNPRDAIGKLVDSYDDPFTIIANDHGVTELLTARFIADGVDERASVLDVLDDLQKNSVDFYAQLRSLSQQHRDAELRHGAPPPAEPDLYNDPGQTSPAPTGPAKPVTQVPAAHQTAMAVMPRRQVASVKEHQHIAARSSLQPGRKAVVRCSSTLTRASAPPLCKTPANSERRVASSLIVPLK